MLISRVQFEVLVTVSVEVTFCWVVVWCNRQLSMEQWLVCTKLHSIRKSAYIFLLSLCATHLMLHCLTILYVYT